MANVSNFLATALLNQVFRNTNYTRPTTVYVALYTTNPTAADTGTEVSGGGYVRQAVTFGAPSAVSKQLYSATTGQLVTINVQTIKSNADIGFPAATADWGMITHVGIRDAATGGNLLYFGALDNPRSILTGDVYKMLSNALAAALY